MTSRQITDRTRTPNGSHAAHVSSTPSSKEREAHHQWIAGRVATLLCHYWRDDDPEMLMGATARDWVKILEGLPQDAIDTACLRYLRDEPRRKPTPGAIYAMARAEIPRPAVVHRLQPPPELERPPRVSAERATEILQEFGFAPKKFGGGGD